MSEPVAEDTARLALDRVLSGIRDTQAAAGMIPGGRAAEDFARGVVDDTIRKHEARPERAPPPRETDPGESPSRITRGEVGPNAAPIGRDVEQSARGREHLHPRQVPLEIALLEGRLELLRYFPCEPGCTVGAEDAGHFHPWGFDAHVEGSGAIRKGKLAAAVDEAIVLTRKSGWTDDDPRTMARVCEAMLKVVEDSGMPFAMGGLNLGDYKALRAETYVRLPRRGGLIPMSQLPKHAPVIGGQLVAAT